MKIILIVLAIILIPIIVNMYLFAIDLKLQGKKDITVEMVFDEMGEMIFICTAPVVSVFGMIFVIGVLSYEFIKNVKLL